MAREEICILTNMCMIYDDNGNILVQNRVNPNWPGICFPGGHVEENESFVKSCIREVKEETGLDIYNLRLCGLKQYSVDNKRYIVIYYKTNAFKGELISSDEGEVFWIKRSDLLNYKLCNGFLEMVKVFEDDSLSENYYVKENNEWSLKNL